MLNLRLATVAVNQTPLDHGGNLRRMTAGLEELSRLSEAERPDVVLFPELSLTGYGCEDVFHSEDLQRRALANLRLLARNAGDLLPGAAVIAGLPVRRDDRIYNCAATLLSGKIRGLTPKRNLAGDGVHYEPRWFAEFREPRQFACNLDGELVPFGNLLFEHRGVRFCIEICEDSWVARRPAFAHLQRGLDLVLNPSASHFAFEKRALRERIALESSRSLGVVFALVNLLGNEAGRMIYDGSSVVGAAGELLASDAGFSFADRRIQRLTVDIEKYRTLRSRGYSYLRQTDNSETDRNAERDNPLVQLAAPAEVRERRIGFSDLARSGATPDLKEATRAVIAGHASRNEEFLRAVALGLFDYLRKSQSRGFMLSLSGGADSATCALLVQRMLAASFYELGARAALERLGRADLCAALESAGVLIAPGASGEALQSAVRLAAHSLLATVYQATENSSETTRSAAAAVADATGARHTEVQIQSLVDGYAGLAEQALGRRLDWARDDLALQNIQARTRAPLVWLLANLEGRLLLTTSNRSEAAVGYCTMDGDTAGGLAPISGIDKAFVQSWLAWMESVGDPWLGPAPQLKLITAQAPTAELRPLERGQTDEADLMPYRLLDRIEKLAIRDRKSPRDIFLALRGAAEAPDDARLQQFIRRFFKLWSQNQWKRERYAPAFHLDDLNLDPRTWYRFPILSGGYVEELNDLPNV